MTTTAEGIPRYTLAGSLILELGMYNSVHCSTIVNVL